MAVKKILTEPNKVLRQVSKNVDKVGNEERELMNDMLDTMYDALGIGLAAIQIGVPKRIIVMDISKDEDKKEPRYFVNPIIKKKMKRKQSMKRGAYLYQTNLQKQKDLMHVKLNIWTTMEKKNY